MSRNGMCVGLTLGHVHGNAERFEKRHGNIHPYQMPRRCGSICGHDATLINLFVACLRCSAA
jgi:hypothetical protein